MSSTAMKLRKRKNSSPAPVRPETEVKKSAAKRSTSSSKKATEENKSPAKKRAQSPSPTEKAATASPSPSPAKKRSGSPAPTKKAAEAKKTPVKRAQTPSKSAATPKADKNADEDYADGTNFVSGGVEENGMLFALLLAAPALSVLFAHLTSAEFKASGVQPHLSVMVPACLEDVPACGQSLLNIITSAFPPSAEAAKFIGCFMAVGAMLEFLPGKIETGPETLTGHIPKYKDNGVLHCLVFTFLFFAGSNLGWGNLYDFGIMYDNFPGYIAFLNMFGIAFCLFLTYKGLNFPSTADCGSSGSVVKDFLWGTELYPRIMNWDLKRFINCRFSMTFWQLAGLSFAYRSYTLHNSVDYGLLLAAVSQYLYLFKFFWWEMGYMRSIDIIVDRAGFEIQWGCLVWVPAVYTLHSRFCVQNPSNLSLPVALGLFALSLFGVILNYAADRERDVFRATNGQALIWGKKPKFIEAEYTIIDRKTGKATKKTSLLLASGFWGIARHFQYFFELTAAYSWCFLANPVQNGVLPMFYAVFLTYLLIDRATRDSKKCHLKYGKHYEAYCELVPYKIIPGVY
jgi:7-dehydrocholesterol reductase